MDQTQLQQNIAKYYTKLPGGLQQSFSSMTWMEDLKNISTKYSLNEEQIETLGTETTLVLLGIIHLEDYVLTLKKDLKLNDETFNKILDDLDVTILKDIKDDLVNTFELNVEFLNNENNIEGNNAPISEKEIVKTTEDEVPLPPYAKIITNDQLPNTDEVKEKTNNNVQPALSTESPTTIEVPKENPVLVNKPDEELKYIPKNVFEDKMTVNTSSGHTVSDHSNTKIDPYREQF